MTIKVLVVPADDNQPVQEREINPGYLRFYQEVVGGHIEALSLFDPRATLYFNDEGKLTGLPVNARATDLLWHYRPERLGEDVLVGDVIVTGPVDNEGHDTSVPASLLIGLQGA